jgi:Ion channel
MTVTTSTQDQEPEAQRQKLFRSGIFKVEAVAADSYGLLLGLLIIDYLILSINLKGPWAIITATLFLGSTALLAFHTSLVRGRWLRITQILVAVAMMAAVASALDQNGRGRGIVFAILALLILACPIVIIARVVHHDRVTIETLLGAICVYVLIGLVYAVADLSVQLISGSPFFAQTAAHTSPDFLYFSFITMTSVGYGDLSPALGLPRTMAVMEALTGQIFLVVMVSRLVALFTPKQRARRRFGKGRSQNDPGIAGVGGVTVDLDPAFDSGDV